MCVCVSVFVFGKPMHASTSAALKRYTIKWNKINANQIIVIIMYT